MMPAGGVAQRSAARIVAARTMAAVLAVLVLAGCVARPIGDFGRAAPGFTHDTAMPAVGTLFAQQRGEPVSTFNQTDIEREMFDRTWRFLVSAHVEDWFMDAAVELQRTRITAVGSKSLGIERYYAWLHAKDFRSSAVRYAAMRSDILADLDTVPGTFTAICAVRTVDRQRATAVATLPVGQSHAAEAAERHGENEMRIAWFTNALEYRYRSYDYALNHLLVETPHHDSVAVDAELSRLAVFVQRALAGDFCDSGVVAAPPAGPAKGQPVPSRFATGGGGTLPRK